MTDVVGALEQIASLSPELALREATPLLAAHCRALRDRVGQLVESAPPAAFEPHFETLVLRDWSLQLFVWPHGARTPIHDHTSWGIYVCLAGALGEERYTRLDDGSRSGSARLAREWRTVWRPGGQSTLMPYSGGIHRVCNAGLQTAVSLHLYGPQSGAMDGRDYDPRRDLVCDRPRDLAA